VERSVNYSGCVTCVCKVQEEGSSHEELGQMRNGKISINRVSSIGDAVFLKAILNNL
jgi:hypothetical protein